MWGVFLQRRYDLNNLIKFCSSDVFLAIITATITALFTYIVSFLIYRKQKEDKSIEYDISLILDLIDKKQIEPIFVYVFNQKSFIYNFDQKYRGIDELKETFLTAAEKERFYFNKGEKYVKNGKEYIDYEIGIGFCDKPNKLICGTYKIIVDFKLIESYVTSKKYKNIFGNVVKELDQLSNKKKYENSIIEDMAKMCDIDERYKQVNVKHFNDPRMTFNFLTKDAKCIDRYIKDTYLSKYIKSAYIDSMKG